MAYICGNKNSKKTVCLILNSFLMVFLLLGYPNNSVAKTYKFRDENGKLHFTNDPEKVPEKYRENSDKKPAQSRPLKNKTSQSKVYKNNCVSSKGEYTALHAAARNNKISEARLLLSNGSDIEARNHSCFTPLQEAAFENNLEMVELLLSKGANPNVVGDREMLLRSVVTMNKIKLVELLIKHGASVNAITDKNKNTALMQATDFNRVAIIQLLLANGAYINSRDDKGLTALGIALKRGNKETVELLRSNGGKE